MDRVFDTIERLRHADEATRKWAMVLTVGAAVLLIGVVWAATLRWQFGSAAPSAASTENEAVNASLPSLGELFSRTGEAAGENAKDQLRDLLLGEEPAPAEPSLLQTAPLDEGSGGTRLPSSSQK